MNLNKESISLLRKQIKQLNPYQRKEYGYYLHYFLRKYNTRFERFLQEYWQDIIVVDKHPTSLPNLKLIQPRIFEIPDQDVKKLAHDLLTGKLIFSENFKVSFFQQSFQESDEYKLPESNNYLHLYDWKKNLNFPKPQRLNFFKKDRRTSNWANSNHRTILRNLKSTPIFVPVNGFHHPILSVPVAEYAMNALDRFYFFYFDWFIWQKDIMSFPIKKGFFFLNPTDANEFIQTSLYKSPRASKRYSPLQVFPMNLGLAYKWNRTSPPRLQFRFVPDVKEVGNLIFKYQYYKNIKIHPSQIITKNKFKGVPIYSIKTIKCRKKDNSIVNVSYTNLLDKSQEKSKILFTSLKSVNEAWGKFKKQYSELPLPNKPLVEVYNLEGYLRDCEINLSDECKNFRIVPSQESYKFAQQFAAQNNKSAVYFGKYKILPTFKRVKLWSQYFFWALTTAKRPEW
uniref:hypothetical protein n=1 Tax=Madagascaria erythrocladioides TaxID=753684 RepID=UPI001FCDEDC4|nr:hypothetical protein MW574_pgp056 [Madagascaria erythrocladioides]UNJ16611.1 hypothetical protein [Madagascaria erythrocladioides]